MVIVQETEVHGAHIPVKASAGMGGLPLLPTFLCPDQTISSISLSRDRGGHFFSSCKALKACKKGYGCRGQVY